MLSQNYLLINQMDMLASISKIAVRLGHYLQKCRPDCLKLKDTDRIIFGSFMGVGEIESKLYNSPLDNSNE